MPPKPLTTQDEMVNSLDVFARSTDKDTKILALQKFVADLEKTTGWPKARAVNFVAIAMKKGKDTREMFDLIKEGFPLEVQVLRQQKAQAIAMGYGLGQGDFDPWSFTNPDVSYPEDAPGYASAGEKEEDGQFLNILGNILPSLIGAGAGIGVALINKDAQRRNSSPVPTIIQTRPSTPQVQPVSTTPAWLWPVVIGGGFLTLGGIGLAIAIATKKG